MTSSSFFPVVKALVLGLGLGGGVPIIIFRRLTRWLWVESRAGRDRAAVDGATAGAVMRQE